MSITLRACLMLGLTSLTPRSIVRSASASRNLPAHDGLAIMRLDPSMNADVVLLRGAPAEGLSALRYCQ